MTNLKFHRLTHRFWKMSLAFRSQPSTQMVPKGTRINCSLLLTEKKLIENYKCTAEPTCNPQVNGLVHLGGKFGKLGWPPRQATTHHTHHALGSRSTTTGHCTKITRNCHQNSAKPQFFKEAFGKGNDFIEASACARETQ